MSCVSTDTLASPLGLANPSQRPSGENHALRASSVPGRGMILVLSIDRRNKVPWFVPNRALPAIHFPSGEIAYEVCVVAPNCPPRGRVITKRAVGTAGGALRVAIEAIATADAMIATTASAIVTGFLSELRTGAAEDLRGTATVSRDPVSLRVIFPSRALSNSSIEFHLSAGILSSATSSALATVSGTLGLSERTLRGRSVS